MSRLTPKLRADLAYVIRTFDSAIASERVRWGDRSAEHLAAIGVEVESAVGLRALHALVDRGLLTMNARAVSHKIDRRGAYGRRIGGTRTIHSAALYFVPTEAGRAAVQKG